MHTSDLSCYCFVKAYYSNNDEEEVGYFTKDEVTIAHKIFDEVKKIAGPKSRTELWLITRTIVTAFDLGGGYKFTFTDDMSNIKTLEFFSGLTTQELFDHLNSDELEFYELLDIFDLLALRDITVDEIDTFLLKFLNHEKAVVREAVIYCLSVYRSDKAHALITSMALNDTSNAVREAAKEFLIIWNENGQCIYSE